MDPHDLLERPGLHAPGGRPAGARRPAAQFGNDGLYVTHVSFDHAGDWGVMVVGDTGQLACSHSGASRRSGSDSPTTAKLDTWVTLSRTLTRRCTVSVSLSWARKASAPGEKTASPRSDANHRSLTGNSESKVTLTGAPFRCSSPTSPAGTVTKTSVFPSSQRITSAGRIADRGSGGASVANRRNVTVIVPSTSAVSRSIAHTSGGSPA